MGKLPEGTAERIAEEFDEDLLQFDQEAVVKAPSGTQERG